MDSIDALIAARVAAPAGIAAGEVPVWNGSAFVRGPLTSFSNGPTINGTTDLAWTYGYSPNIQLMLISGSGTPAMRSLGAPNVNGQVVTITSFGPITIKNALAGGTGAQFATADGADLILGVGVGSRNSSAQFAYDGGSWREVNRPAFGVSTAYKKNTAKQVVNTVAETDLLNGEVTVGAGAIGANGTLRLTAWGDWTNGSGAAIAPPRFKLVLGGVTLLDSSAMGLVMSSAGGTRFAWNARATIQNLGAANSQWSALNLQGGSGNGVGSAVTGPAAGEGLYQAIISAGGFGWLTLDLGGASAIDTSVAKALQLTVINGAANANVDVTLKGALVEIL
jgi:hypothetical protein